MIRRLLILGIIIELFDLQGARAWAGTSDSTRVDSAGWSAPPIWHPTRADTLMFQSVSRRVKPDASARVFSRSGVIEVRGGAMSLRGVRFSQPESTLSWASVSKVQVRKSAAGQGALVGGIVFGAAGLIGMASMTHDCGSFEITCGATSGDVIAGTVGAFAIGTLVGTIVAAPFHSWKDIAIDREIRSPNGSTFDGLRRGFTIELGAGPGWASVSNPLSGNANRDGMAFTRFRLGHGISERWALAYVNDVAWSDGLAGISGAGFSRFTSPKAPSLVLEVVGGVSTRQTADQSLWSTGVQAGLGLEFARHWLMRATLLHTSFEGISYNVAGTSISRLWY